MKAFKIGMAKDCIHDQGGGLFLRCLFNTNSLISQKQHTKNDKIEYNSQLCI